MFTAAQVLQSCSLEEAAVGAQHAVVQVRLAVNVVADNVQVPCRGAAAAQQQHWQSGS